MESKNNMEVPRAVLEPVDPPYFISANDMRESFCLEPLDGDYFDAPLCKQENAEKVVELLLLHGDV